MGETAISGFGSDVAHELKNVEADPRLGRRAQRMLERWQEKPGLGFPEVFPTGAELEAAYRFFGNVRLSFDVLAKPHIANALGRSARHESDVLCIHDTSTFVFEGEREGLGYINKNNRGFLGHFCLAASSSQDGVPVPFGVVAASTWTRTTPRGAKSVSQHQLRESGDCESLRWLDTVRAVEHGFEGKKSPIHVMDREGDIYDSLSTMVASRVRFVVRAMSNRRVESSDTEFPLLFDALDGLPVRYQQTIQVTARKGSRLPEQRKVHPSRDGREAHVCVTATQVVLERTRNSPKAYPAKTPINVVHAFESQPPPGECPVEWVLLTSEPIDTDDELSRVVDKYRQRWLIEEFFKAIKTGCAFEKRQLETYHSLRNALAMTLPIAWEMLLLRSQSRQPGASSPPATTFVDPLRLDVLREASKRQKRYVLPPAPTLRDVAYAVAALGGHLRRNGPPGWLTLRRGYDRLLTLEEGWLMSRERCDQS